ncbi:MAG TPA: ornithine cyclodeaminase family protein [Gaiellales bacterium]|nr:ornithine cyclodeaminase family protein [Gaiellales bacterium]
MLVLSRRDVEAALDPDRLVDAVAAAMAELSAGRASVPPRTAAEVAGVGGVLLAMPAHLPGLGALAAKLVALFPQNAARGIPTHRAIVAAFDPETGTPEAVMDGEVVTAMRTAAGSALSARLLAREDASVLAILGTGVQARAHAEAVRRVRPIREVRIAGRDAGKAGELAEELGAVVAGSYEEAIAGADIVCACTHSPEPVVRGEWLDPGTHVTSVGVNPVGRELDADAVARALVVVESRAAAVEPFPVGSNDLAWAIRDGVVGADHVHAEIGELVAGTRPGRTSAGEVTLYKSVGVAAQDAAAAALVLDVARERGLGTEVEM